MFDTEDSEFHPVEASIFVIEFITICFIIYYILYKRILKPLNTLAIAREKIKKKYFLTFERRDALMYHIGSCKERGDLKDAKRMTIDLDQVDQELDALEAELKTSHFDFVRIHYGECMRRGCDDFDYAVLNKKSDLHSA